MHVHVLSANTESGRDGDYYLGHKFRRLPYGAQGAQTTCPSTYHRSTLTQNSNFNTDATVITTSLLVDIAFNNLYDNSA